MEILKRKIKVEKTEIEHDQMQVAYNSSGRLTIRLYCSKDRNRDLLICFTAAETKKLAGFLTSLSPLL